jgi:hypothetical protein
MSNNLNLDQVAPSQSSKEATINAATGELDAALTELQVIDMTASVIMTALNYQRHLKFSLTPTGTGMTLTLPAQKKFSIISNDGTHPVNITVGTTTIALANGTNGFFYTDGTVNGLAQQGGGSGGGGGSITLTTTGTGGLASLAGSTLNIPHYQDLLTLTTTGTSGAATLAGGALNIPNYATGGGGGGVTISDTPPGSPAVGALWYDSTATQLYIWYNDGNSSQWVVATNQGANVVPLAGPRNRIINGSMLIDQRGLAAGGFTPVSGTYLIDRWLYSSSLAGGKLGFYTAQTGPVGTASFLVGYTAVTTSLAASDFSTIQQTIEANNIADLGFGAAGAKSVTLSFLVYSTMAGTHSGAFIGASPSRSYPFTFSLAANTWTPISVTIPGDTAGTWPKATNAAGLTVRFNLGAGATYLGPAGAWASANYVGATGSVQIAGGAVNSAFYITNVQLEVGSVATPFEWRSISTEMNMCQRYFQMLGGPGAIAGITQIQTYASAAGQSYTATFAISPPMRAAPTQTILGTWTSINAGAPSFAFGTNAFTMAVASVAAGAVAFYNPANGGLSLSAEL